MGDFSFQSREKIEMPGALKRMIVPRAAELGYYVSGGNINA